MNKKQLKKIRRAKLLKKKHNIWKNEQNLPIFDMTDPNTIWDILSGEGSPMMNSKDFIAYDCSLCGKEVTDIHDSHNAFPLKSDTTAKKVNGKQENDRCCSDCNNTKVLPARFGQFTNCEAEVA